MVIPFKRMGKVGEIIWETQEFYFGRNRFEIYYDNQGELSSIVDLCSMFFCCNIDENVIGT